MIPARQSTALEIAVGPVLDADGVAVTNCVVGDFKIKKTTGNFAALNGSATLTHVSAGVYDLVLTTSDTDTVGLCTIAIDDTVNACQSIYLQVMEEAVYDRDYAASATGIIGTAQTGDTYAIVNSGTHGNAALKTQIDAGNAGYRGTAQAGGTNTITLDTGASATNSIYRSRAIKIVSGTGAEQVRTITAYNGTTKVATVNRLWNVQPDNTSVFVVLNTGPSDMVASWGVGGDDGYGPAGFNALAAEYIDNGGISSVVIGTTGDVITAASLSADAITEIQSGLSTLTAAQVNAEVDTALADYDGPTNAEMVARTLAAASYATSAAQTTAQNDLDILTGTDGVTLATSQPNYAPATSAQAVAIQGATFDTSTDSLEAIRNRGDAAWGTATGFSTLDAAGVRTAVGLASANLDTQLAAIVADTNELQTNQGNWLTATGFSTHSAADVVTALGTGSSLTALATQTSVNTVAGYLDTEVAAILAAVDTEVAAIKAKTDNLPASPAATGDIPTAAAIRAEIDSNSTQLAAIVADTNELQADWANGGRLDLILDARSSQTSVDDLPTNSELATALAAADDAVLAQVALVKAKTDNLPSDPADQSAVEAAITSATSGLATAANLATVAGYLDTEIAAILEDTGTTIPAQIAALNNLSSAEAQSAATAALAAYDPPTKAELDAAHSATDGLITTVDGVVDGIAADLPARITKNTALANFPFKMVDTNGDPVTGLTVTATRSLDGAAFEACTNSPSEISNGWYKISLAAADTNGNTGVLRFTGTGAKETEVVFITQNT